jgi:hypothetical protein
MKKSDKEEFDFVVTQAKKIAIGMAFFILILIILANFL